MFNQKPYTATFEWWWFFAPLLSCVVLYGVISEFFFSLDIDPVHLPVLELSEERELELRKIQSTVSEAISSGGPLNVSLSADLINAWVKLSTHEELRVIGEHSWITFQDGKVIAQISLPLEIFGKPGFYFNGDGVFSLSLRDGRLLLGIDSLSSRNPRSSGFTSVIQGMGGESLLEKFRLRDAIPDALRSRCSAECVGNSLQLSCTPTLPVVKEGA